ncbi:hydroxypyruvate isomerase family protein [Ahrensia kielensis]|uniref:hydroxypyruvate isomerase family protein n=1 Tax=Ahrensia kielensis TaxID=76980 RepID=UPI00035CEAC8|nr:TIM barrel protein [Ahrensia kielensis]
MNHYRFSANTGFLWKELPFIDRIRRAAACGFDAVEFHDEAQQADTLALSDVLTEAGLRVLGLNVRMGETAGCAAIASREKEALKDIDIAIETAQRIGAGSIHVLAGRTGDEGNRSSYLRALRHALNASDITILIEPICRAAMPDYFLHDIDQAAEILDEIDNPRLRILFDCYHIEAEHGAMMEQFHKHKSRIGHIQIASFPERAEPNQGSIDYGIALREFLAAGYGGFFGCEYNPKKAVEVGLSWRDQFQLS